MGKTDTTHNNIGRPGAVENEAATPRSQLSFFDTVTPPTMISENSTEHMHAEAGSPTSESTPELPHATADTDPAAEPESCIDSTVEAASEAQQSEPTPAEAESCVDSTVEAASEAQQSEPTPAEAESCVDSTVD